MQIETVNLEKAPETKSKNNLPLKIEGILHKCVSTDTTS